MVMKCLVATYPLKTSDMPLIGKSRIESTLAITCLVVTLLGNGSRPAYALSLSCTATIIVYEQKTGDPKRPSTASNELDVYVLWSDNRAGTYRSFGYASEKQGFQGYPAALAGANFAKASILAAMPNCGNGGIVRH
jgi:hypothetical protein